MGKNKTETMQSYMMAIIASQLDLQYPKKDDEFTLLLKDLDAVSAEVELIKQKKSKLSANKRSIVMAVYEKDKNKEAGNED